MIPVMRFLFTTERNNLLLLLCHARLKIIPGVRLCVCVRAREFRHRLQMFRLPLHPLPCSLSLSLSLVRRDSGCVYRHGHARSRTSPCALSSPPVAALPCPKTRPSSVKRKPCAGGRARLECTDRARLSEASPVDLRGRHAFYDQASVPPAVSGRHR